MIAARFDGCQSRMRWTNAKKRAVVCVRVFFFFSAYVLNHAAFSLQGFEFLDAEACGLISWLMYALCAELIARLQCSFHVFLFSYCVLSRIFLKHTDDCLSLKPKKLGLFEIVL